MKKLLIVGGGNAGFISALILKTRFPKMKIDMVFSKDIGTIGVGEGSTEHWTAFMEFVGIDTFELIRETNATFKGGIYFKNWADEDYMHSVTGDIDNQRYGQLHTGYLKQIVEGKDYRGMLVESMWNSTVDKNLLQQGRVPVNQFHFNSLKLNDYLKKKCLEKGVNIFDDEIVDVEFCEQGDIKSVVGKKDKYNYDFYIDSTGLKRYLISKMESEWKTFDDCLKVNSAFVFQTEAMDELPMWTLAQALDYGWMFRIPVTDHTGYGYIFDDRHIDSKQAQKEVEKVLGRKIENGRTIKFNPGYSDKTWVKNCCATGLSSIFIEPLEASSIGSTIQQTFLFMHRLTNYDQNTIDSFNASMRNVFDNIRDYIVLHYLTKKTNTQFWIDAANVKLSPILERNMKLWKNNLPIYEDFSGLSNYAMFNVPNFIMVLHGLGLFDKKSLRKIWKKMPKWVKNLTCNICGNSQQNMISHKDAIKFINVSHII